MNRIAQNFHDSKSTQQYKYSSIFKNKGINTEAAELYAEWNFEGGFDNSIFTAAKPKIAFFLKHLSRIYYQLDHIIFPLVFDVETVKKTLPKLNKANIWSCYLYFLEDDVLLHSKASFTRMLESFKDPNRQAGNRIKYKKVLLRACVDDQRFLVKDLEGEENNPNHKDVLKMLKVVRERESLLKSLFEDRAELLNIPTREHGKVLSASTAGMASSPRTHEDYQIRVICALATEKAAMVAMINKTHPKLRKKSGDENEYTLGRISVHNVVIACLPAGMMGMGPAAIVANNMRHSFPIKFGLMVRVGGGVWSKNYDIRLGDVVVSEPTGTHGGVVQWDFGKMGKDGKFRRTGLLNKPPLVLLYALQSLKEQDITDGIDLTESLSLIIRNKPKMGENYRYQGIEYDHLFKATYDHEGDETCEGCDNSLLVQRPARKVSIPKLHYGNIASGNEVMKHGITRDNIAKEEGIICFEMEAAGLMDNFPCLVIRGICDYADSHKNKIWQPYAAATAAAYARVLLGFIDELEVTKTPRD